jgi:hypothetical protein
MLFGFTTGPECRRHLWMRLLHEYDASGSASFAAWAARSPSTQPSNAGSPYRPWGVVLAALPPALARSSRYRLAPNLPSFFVIGEKKTPKLIKIIQNGSSVLWGISNCHNLVQSFFFFIKIARFLYLVFGR